MESSVNVRNELISAQVPVKNLPRVIRTGFMVVRLDRSTLWYYGTYDTADRAYDVALELGNGLVIKPMEV